MNSAEGWHPMTDEYHTRLMINTMKKQGWKVRVNPVGGRDWEASCYKWDSRGSHGGMGRCYGYLFSKAVCYATVFALESLQAVNAAFAE